MPINIILQIIVLIFLFVIIIMLLRKSISLRKEKRISYYALDSLTDNERSISDKIFQRYLAFIKKMRRKMNKNKYFKKKAKKYEKYIKYKYRDIFEAIDFITNKIVISLIFTLLAIFSQIIVNAKINVMGIIINFIIGYYLLDIYLFTQYRRQMKAIENDLLRAIIIMNNAFKSGKSTLQALEIASLELPEPICDEFKKMYFDMKYGLSVDTVFDRFAKRVNLEEAVYLSSSLMILDKTGGNIIEVFSSIEKTLFDKKKLDEELKNITASSNMIVKILFVVPFVFIGIIYILNPKYFEPLFESPIGYILISIAILMFIIYIILLRKIMKIEV